MFNGRIDRTAYLLGYLYTLAPIVIVIMMYAFLAYFLPSDGQHIFRSIVNIVLFLFGAVWIILLLPVSIGLSIRRWHDVEQSGWLSILGFISPISIVVFILQLVLAGTKGPNKYGAQLSPRQFVDVLFG